MLTKENTTNVECNGESFKTHKMQIFFLHVICADMVNVQRLGHILTGSRNKTLIQVVIMQLFLQS